MEINLHLRRALTIAVAGAAVFLAAAAGAAEIVFYEYADFAGRSLTLRGQARNFSDLAFNDRASSLVVQSGTWEVCTDADFKGACVKLERGEYAQLDARLDSRISSAREIGSYRDVEGAYRDHRRGALELFAGEDFRGASVVVDRDAGNFAELGFNDRARSLIVRDGHWELCGDAWYRGACRIFGPGRYADLGPGWARQISSARRTGTDRDAPYVIGGGGPRVPQDQALRVVFYDQEGFVGRSFAITRNTVDFAATGFNDQALSVLVEGGAWEVCTDAFFQGRCQVLPAGPYRRLEPALQRSISSARFALPINGPPQATGRRETAEIELFEHDDFGGRKFAARGAVEDLNNQNFNDITSSLVVYAGQWELCEHARFAGRCLVFGPGRYPNLRGFNDQISSLRRLDR